MAHRIWDSATWLAAPLCIRYLVAHFGALDVPTVGAAASGSDRWHWAIGFHAEGEFELLGAWRDEGTGTPQRIASDLQERGIERLRAVAAEGALTAHMAGVRPLVCRRTLSELEACGVFGGRTRRVIRWTGQASQAANKRLAALIKRHGPVADAAEGTEVVATSLQRVQLELFDGWRRRGGRTPYGAQATSEFLSAAAA
ncbi:hypothetical protein [Roseateles sp.]|uniref:hypothetical protein n=1 Tax=Roseateles sp. TaxID=1971397 RepID=UPI0025F18BD6|nr:hypothetical protein [Roseateles sp.]MBV8037414.1 hypothetical protein [Roseateles sp.]